MANAITPIFFRPRDLNGVPAHRKIFNALVIGAQNCGKTSFLESFVEAPSSLRQLDRNKSVFSCIKAIRKKDNKDHHIIKYLMLKEVREEDVTSPGFLTSSQLLNGTDVVLFLYENDYQQKQFIKETYEKM